ncbi:MAG: ATP-dependent Clp protease proteolytic subunit [Burkholderiaceae bacterium]
MNSPKTSKTSRRAAAPALPTLAPDIRLFGNVDQAMLGEFFRQQSEVKPRGPLVLELSTSGGNADIGRRIGQEIRLWREHQHREVFFLGKTYVYSAGVTIMSFFPPTHRFVTNDCEFLIHERKLKKELHLEGALRGCRSMVQDVLAEIDSGQRLEREGFAQLVQGTALTVDDVQRNVLDKDWYLTAPQALEAGLVAGVI